MPTKRRESTPARDTWEATRRNLRAIHRIAARIKRIVGKLNKTGQKHALPPRRVDRK